MTIQEAMLTIEKMGFVALPKQNDFCAFTLGQGSLANGARVHIGRPRTVHAPNGETFIGVFVDYEAWSEAGEDLCDYRKTESRNVRVEDLAVYLAQRGFRVGG